MSKNLLIEGANEEIQTWIDKGYKFIYFLKASTKSALTSCISEFSNQVYNQTKKITYFLNVSIVLSILQELFLEIEKPNQFL